MLREILERDGETPGSWQLALLPLPAAALGKSASSATSALIGGLIVTTKQKIAVAAVLMLLLCGGAAYVAATLPGTAPAPEEFAEAPAVAPAEDDAPPERQRVQPGEPGEAAAEDGAAEDTIEEVAEETPVVAPAPPPVPARAALTYTVLRHVPPREVPKGYTELLPGEEPVIEDAGTSMGGGRGPRMLPYWRRWAPVPEKGTVTIRGRVTDAAGRALEGAEVFRVKLDENGQRASPSSFQWVKKLATTDATGFYEAADVPAGDYLITADFRAAMRRARGLDISPAVPVSAVDDQALQGVDVNLPIEAARFGIVSGLVVDEKSEPKRNAEVWGPMQRLYTDEEGRFEMGGLQPGVTELTARATGYAPTKLEVDLAPGGRADVTFELELAEQGDLTLEGRVIDEDGVAVKGAKVFVAASRGGSRWAETDAAGVFRFENMDRKYAKKSVKVMVSPHPGRDLFKPLGPPIETTVPAPGLELVVQRTARVHVLLQDEDTGEPLPLFAIECQIETTIDGEKSWRTFHSMSRYAESGEAAFSVPKGRFRLTIRAKDHRGVEVEIDVADTSGPKEVRVSMKAE
jgi:protocatechuate 3,4-dioxygenase beta subunit